MKKIRLRFAPSPTGALHIGSLRTILFTYLISKQLDGKFILRIEDTDQKRTIAGSIEGIIESLNWIGIKFDEGAGIINNSEKDIGEYGPYIQSQRLDIYKKYIDKLLENNHAYHCFCTPDRLQKMREEQQANKLPPRYDGRCRDLNKQEIAEKLKNNDSFVIRQKIPANQEIKIYDELRGEIKFQTNDLEDHVLIKSNGIPTYQFASVIDDHVMEISHVTRGEEWIPSFPKNVLLYQALDWEVPKFIHFPAVLNKNGGKLSKRDGDVAVEDYRIKGYLPEVLLNFCALLGWHPKDDEEILSLEELIKKFNYKNIKPSGAIFDQDKLDYFNGYYIRNKSIEELIELCKPYLEDDVNKTLNNQISSEEYIKKIVTIEQERLKKIPEIKETTKFFFTTNLEYAPELLIWKKMETQDVKNNLEKIYNLLEKISLANWKSKLIEEEIINYLKNNELKIGNYLWPMRVALTGQAASPGPFDVADIIGKEESLSRIKQAISLF